jgi:hypothetical protein
MPESGGGENAHFEKLINEGSSQVALKHAEGADETNTKQNDRHRCSLRTEAERKIS